MKTEKQAKDFSAKYAQEKDQILTLINDLALKMQNDSIADNPNDYLTGHSISMETNKFAINFSFKDVRHS